MICPHCGNRDPKMLDVHIGSVEDTAVLVYCKVCSKTFLHSIGKV